MSSTSKQKKPQLDRARITVLMHATGSEYGKILRTASSDTPDVGGKRVTHGIGEDAVTETLNAGGLSTMHAYFNKLSASGTSVSQGDAFSAAHMTGMAAFLIALAVPTASRDNLVEELSNVLDRLTLLGRVASASGATLHGVVTDNSNVWGLVAEENDKEQGVVGKDSSATKAMALDLLASGLMDAETTIDLQAQATDPLRKFRRKGSAQHKTYRQTLTTVYNLPSFTSFYKHWLVLSNLVAGCAALQTPADVDTLLRACDDATRGRVRAGSHKALQVLCCCISASSAAMLDPITSSNKYRLRSRVMELARTLDLSEADIVGEAGTIRLRRIQADLKQRETSPEVVWPYAPVEAKQNDIWSNIHGIATEPIADMFPEYALEAEEPHKKEVAVDVFGTMEGRGDLGPFVRPSPPGQAVMVAATAGHKHGDAIATGATASASASERTPLLREKPKVLPKMASVSEVVQEQARLAEYIDKVLRLRQQLFMTYFELHNGVTEGNSQALALTTMFAEWACSLCMLIAAFKVAEAVPRTATRVRPVHDPTNQVANTIASAQPYLDMVAAVPADEAFKQTPQLHALVELACGTALGHATKNPSLGYVMLAVNVDQRV